MNSNKMYQITFMSGDKVIFTDVANGREVVNTLLDDIEINGKMDSPETEIRITPVQD